MVKKIFDFLFYNCRHKWEIFNSGTIVDDKREAIGSWYDLKCSKCGKIKRTRFKE